MSNFHFIALHTYGREKQRNQSCFKIGQGVNAQVLVTLFGSRAIDLTPPQASYRYIHLSAASATTHKNYIVLRLTEDEKIQVEQIARTQGHFVTIYLWEPDGRRWLQFPCSPQAHYSDPSSYGGSCPKFPPTAAPFLTPSKLTADTVEAKSSGGITLTQSGDWWWIAGDTYPHRENLRVAGARWSKTRREWYFKGQALPAAIRDLAKATGAPPDGAAIQGTLTEEANLPVPIATPDTPATSPKQDNVQFAIQHMKDAPAPVRNSTPVRVGSATISQEYVGELTGSITGNVHCFGYAVD